MNTNTSRFSLLLAIGLSIAILASLGAPSAARGETWDKSISLPFTSTTGDDPDAELDEKLTQFEGYLADMQHELAIPGMSVAIVKDQELIWAQ